MKVEKLW